MNNQLQIFNYENNKVRTTVKDGEVWFVLKDVCDVLGINNSKMVATRLEQHEKAEVSLTDLSSNGVQQHRNFTIINEPGFYKVVFRSDKPEAKKFTNWVSQEVLPSIRKHGAYITSDKMEELMTNPETWIKLIRTIQQEREEKAKLRNQLKRNKPKVIFADAVSASDTGILIGELAKILKGNGFEIGQNRLFERLRQDGFLMRREGTDYNLPTQRAMNLGLFKIKETAVTHSDGHITINKTVKITGKGQQYFINYFIKNLRQSENLNLIEE